MDISPQKVNLATYRRINGQTSTVTAVSVSLCGKALKSHLLAAASLGLCGSLRMALFSKNTQFLSFPSFCFKTRSLAFRDHNCNAPGRNSLVIKDISMSHARYCRPSFSYIRHGAGCHCDII